MIFPPMSELLNRKFFELRPPKVDYFKCAYDTGDGWYFFWAPLDENGWPEDTGEDFYISEFPLMRDYVTAHELALMGVVVV